MFFTGLIGGGVFCGWLTGRSSFTAWVWIGMVMMNMMRRTSMTSMSGVTLTSSIGSPDSLSLVVCIDIAEELLLGPIAGQRRRLRNKADALESSLLHGDDRRADALVLCVHVTADVRLGHIFFVDVLDAA